VLWVRAEHPAWGGRKITRRLKDLGEEAVPAPSTVTAILKRHGIELGPHGGSIGLHPLRAGTAERVVADGLQRHVALHAGRLHPLTVLDDHSRFSVVLAACTNEQTETVRQHLVCRLPPLWPARRGDHRTNGSPGRRAGQARSTPSRVWLIEHGIKISHSRPYHPPDHGQGRTLPPQPQGRGLGGPPLPISPRRARP